MTQTKKPSKPKPSKPKKTWRYLIATSWGSAKNAVKPGAVLVFEDYYGRQHDWSIFDMDKGDITGGFSGNLVAG